MAKKVICGMVRNIGIYLRVEVEPDCGFTPPGAYDSVYERIHESEEQPSEPLPFE